MSVSLQCPVCAATRSNAAQLARHVATHNVTAPRASQAPPSPIQRQRIGGTK